MSKSLSKLLAELDSRGLVQDISNREETAKLLDSPPSVFYCGFDPTSDSLHVGSLLPLSMMKRLQDSGHSPLALIGSGTGMIGDPSGKSEERVLLSEDAIQSNISGISKQINNILKPDGATGCKIVDNGSWLASLNLIEFLRDTGKHFSVNSMMAKDSVKSRLENREQGISYTEFSYMLLQAYDFYHLWEEHGCSIQIGGSDQWGNITEGIELIRRKSGDSKRKAVGLTFPLLIAASGEKFGKTEKGAVWLSPDKTSPYEFYQYWVNLRDEDALTLLPRFSFRTVEEINSIQTDHQKDPKQRLAQKSLATELTSLVHGEEEVQKAEVAAKVFFGGSVTELPGKTLIDIFQDVPSTKIPLSTIKEGFQIVDLLVECKLEKSKGAAKRSLAGGGVYLNNNRIEDVEFKVTGSDLVDDKVLILRLGKKKYHLVQVA